MSKKISEDSLHGDQDSGMQDSVAGDSSFGDPNSGDPNSGENSVSIAEDRPIVVRGARVHNLKNISVSIPRNRLTVVTGVSGSGKSSLAFDTIYAEGQRRYVESLSSYARQFLERMDKPDVDFMSGISPAMAIQQKTTSTNPRSTVGTATEIYDYLRLLFARVGRTFSPASGEEVQKDTVDRVIAALHRRHEEGARFYILLPLEERTGVTEEQQLALFREKGFTRLLNLETEEIVDFGAGDSGAADSGAADQGAADPGASASTSPTSPDLPNTHATDESGSPINPKKKTKTAKKAPKLHSTHAILVDRLVLKGDDATTTRIADSLETAYREGHGRCIVKMRGGEVLHFSERFERDGMEFTEPSPQMFMFNNPFGACPACEGFGRVAGIDEDLVIPDPEKSIRAGVIAPFDSPQYQEMLRSLVLVAARYRLPIDVPYKELDKETKRIIWDGKDEYIGIHRFFEYVRSKFYKVHMRVLYARYRGYSRCPECEGYRIRKDALYVKVGGLHIGEVSEMTIGVARGFFDGLELTPTEQEVAGQILFEIQKRLKYLDEVGLDYLTLDRLTSTLSGGESQRINLAKSLGSSLIGSLYVLDEPTIGLHPRDNARLIRILKSLRDIGNTVLVVEHDPEMMKEADQIIDIGPFAGSHGGEVVYSGSFDGLMGSATLTGRYLSGREQIRVPEKRRKGSGKELVLVGASENNLKSVDVAFPLGMLVCVTGVSGSGKSTLVNATLYAAVQRELGAWKEKVGRHRELKGMRHVYGVEMVDQSPLGRSTRSNAATYTKAFDGIRSLFAGTRQAKMMGFSPGHFSFNVPGGRCEACEGEGVQKIEMQFMADIELVCEECGGKRFRKEVLQVKYRGQSIHDVLEMSVSDAIAFFSDEASVADRLQPMEDVGLGYLRLGQSATTLSGGEAQRVKLAKFLSRKNAEPTVYFFDEPTTGLHFDDIAKLLRSFHELVDQGHTVMIIEHNLDVIKSADWVIDVGPEGGFGGGQIVAAGTPEEVAAVEASHTGRFLAPLLG